MLACSQIWRLGCFSSGKEALLLVCQLPSPQSRKQENGD